MFFILLGIFSGIYTGLMRMNWTLPSPGTFIPLAHGPLLASGFVGTLIGMERAMAFGYFWCYLAPLSGGLAILSLLLPFSPLWAGIFLTFSSAVLVATMVQFYKKYPTLPVGIMGLGALCWLGGNLFWLALLWKYENPGFVSSFVLWWMAFPVFTIAGERLELARIGMKDRFSLFLFVFALIAFLAGCVTQTFSLQFGHFLGGMGLIALSLWLWWKDVARFSVRLHGLHRYASAGMLSGYAWAFLGGLLLIRFPGSMTGPAYDAFLHSVFLGFLFSMIFAHMPLIFSSVAEIPVPFTHWYYLPLLMLHFSLIMRVAGDLLLIPGWIKWGGMLNAVSLLVFIFIVLISVLQEKRRRSILNESLMER